MLKLLDAGERTLIEGARVHHLVSFTRVHTIQGKLRGHVQSLCAYLFRILRCPCASGLSPPADGLEVSGPTVGAV